MRTLPNLIIGAMLAVCVIPAIAATTTTPPPIVSRAEAVKTIVEGNSLLKQRMEFYRGHMPKLPLFSDVPQLSGLSPYLEAAFEQGVITGNDDRIFRPTEAIRPEEEITLLARALALGNEDAARGVAQGPSAGEEWYAQSLRIVQAQGIPVPATTAFGHPLARASFNEMNQKAIALMKVNQPVQVASSALPTTPVQPQPTVSAPNVPQFLPIKKIQPLTAPTTGQTINSPGTSIVANAGGTDITGASANVNAGQGTLSPSMGGTVQVAQAQGVEISAGNGGGASISAGGGGSTFTDVLSNPQGIGGEINAGGGDVGATGSATSFTINIPSLGIGPLYVSNPEDPFTHDGLLQPLKNGVGHLFGNPGGGGKILVYGHSSSYPWDLSPYTKIFRQINKANIGDTVSIDYMGQTYNYRVSFKETVPANDMTAYQDSGSGEDLILYTCWPPDSITQRYLVHATPI